MKILLILVLFLVGCALEPTVKVEDGGDENQGNNLPIKEECKYVPLEGRKLGEKRSISFSEENNVFLYDFECLGLTDESWEDFYKVFVYYYKSNTTEQPIREITIGKADNEIKWKFEDTDNDIFFYTYGKESFFKKSVEGVDFSKDVKKVSIEIQSTFENNIFFYKGYNSSGDVQLVGIEKNGDCEGDCGNNYPYKPI